MEERAEEFIPGEHVEEFRAAWTQTGFSLEKIVQSLSQQNPPESNLNITDEQMKAAAFTGPEGALKLKILTAEGEEFLAYAVPEPHNEGNIRRAAAAGARLADMGAAGAESLRSAVREVPFLGTACEAAYEGLVATKHLLGWWPGRRRN